MNPITREEYYLAKIAGTWQGKTPEPVTIEEYYLATMAGDYSGNTPQPVTRLQYYMAKAAGVWGGSIPAPVTRLEYYWAAIAGKEGHIPDPVTRQEYLLYAISQSNNDVINTVSGSTIIITDATEGRPFRGLRVFGRTEQQRTTGAQLFDAKTFLKSQIEKGVVSINSDGKIVLNGVIDANNRAFTVTLQPGTYTLSADKPSTWHIIAPTDGVFNQKITVDVETTYNCYIANGTYNNIETTPMINVGSSALPYEPYTGGKPSPSPEYPQEIVSVGESGNITVEVRGKNLFDINSYLTNTGSEIKEGKIEFIENLAKITYQVNLEAGDYTISFNRNMYSSIIVNDGENKLIANGGANNFKNTINLKDDSVLDIIFECGQNPNKEKRYLYDIQIERGLSQASYEPYREPQILTLQTPNGLPGVPVSKDGNYTDPNGQQWICDEIDLERGKYVQRTAEKEVSGITWSGAGTWGNTDDYKTLAFYAYIDGSNINEDWDAVKNYGICNYATITSNVFNNSIIGFTLGDYIAFRVPRSLLPDWDENNASTEPWINWLRKQKEAGNPVIVQYALKTPIERDLTPEEIAAYKALRTYGPTTVVSNDAGVHMEVTYVAER